jgi:CRP/FNR family transcriptional regulator, cyclic AMP receptor protein
MRHRAQAEYLDRLAAVPLFSRLDRDELAAVASLGTDVDVAEGQELTRQGEIGHEAFLVLEGTAACLRDGQEIATFGPGDFFGEMALLAHTPRTATVVVTSPATVRAFHQSEFNELLERSPKVAVAILRGTAERLLASEDSPRH